MSLGVCASVLVQTGPKSAGLVYRYLGLFGPKPDRKKIRSGLVLDMLERNLYFFKKAFLMRFKYIYKLDTLKFNSFNNNNPKGNK